MGTDRKSKTANTSGSSPLVSKHRYLRYVTYGYAFAERIKSLMQVKEVEGVAWSSLRISELLLL